jgi:hypothetical protein
MQTETEIVLANLDWLVYCQGMRLDYGARAVLTAESEVAYTLDDLAVPGLTPATKDMAGRLPMVTCTAAITAPARITPNGDYDGVLEIGPE